MRNNNNKKESNYINKNIKNGPYFMSLKTPTDVTKEAPMILSELAYGKIDLNKWGSMFIFPQYIQGIKQYCEEQVNILTSLDKVYTVAANMGMLMESEFELHQKVIKPKIIIYNNIYGTMVKIEISKSYQPIYKLQQDLSNGYVASLLKKTQI